MQLDKIPKQGTTDGRKRFWDQVADYILASQKIAGKNVSLDVRDGYGSVINVNPQRSKPSGECVACPSSETITVTLSGITLCSGCIDIGSGLSIVITGGDVNGEYVLTRIGSDPTCCFELNIVDLEIPYDLYSGSACDEFFGSSTFSLDVWVGRTNADADCKWSVIASLRGGTPDLLVVFLGGPQSSFSPFTNTVNCGDGTGIFSHPCSVREWEAVGGSGGTATVTA